MFGGVAQSLFGVRGLSTLKIRLRDDKHERLKALAKSNSISIKKLMANWSGLRWPTTTPACASKRAQRGNPKRALRLLDKLDRVG